MEEIITEDNVVEFVPKRITSSGARLVKDKERNLLINSKITESHPELLAFFSGNWRIKKNQLVDLDLVRFFDHMFGQIYTAAKKEWKEDKTKRVEIIDNPDVDVRKCELCGKKKIKYICHIVNESTGCELQVGSECIKEFEFYSNIQEQIKTIKKSIRISELDRIFPDIHNTIRFWNSLIFNAPILINKELEETHISYGKSLERLYLNYVQKDDLKEFDKQDIISEIGLIFADANINKENIKAFISKHSLDKFAPRRSYLTYLQSKNDPSGCNFLIEDREITKKVIFRLGVPQFMESLIDDINFVINDAGFIVDYIYESSRNGYIMKYKEWPDILVYISHHDFFIKWGSNVISVNKSFQPINKVEFISKIKIFGEVASRQALDLLLNLTNYNRIRFVSADYEYDELVFSYAQDDTTYILVKYSSFLDRFKSYVFNCSEENEASIISYISNPDLKHIDKQSFEYIKRQREISGI